jgi:putative FmdB family regulatory protein
MPTYDYRCRKCGHVFELFHSIKDDTIKRCPKCKGRADRLISAGAGILFKGSGFYATDYRSSQYKEKAKQEQSGGTGEKPKGEGGGGGGGGGGDKPAVSEKPRDKKSGAAERKRGASGKRSEPK